MKKRLWQLLLILLMPLLVSCRDDKIWLEKNKPDNGVRKLQIANVNYHYLPLKHAQFLIEDKAWLKGFARNAHDNAVYVISLHALPPKMLPWTKERHSQMYGDGASLNVVTVDMKDIDYPDFAIESYSEPPYGWLNNPEVAIKVIPLPSDNDIGLIRFREEHLKDDINQYVYIQNDRIKYHLRCEPRYCTLEFLRKNKYEVQMRFNSAYLKQSVEMADKLQELLDKFESDGARYAHLAKMTERGKVGVF